MIVSCGGMASADFAVFCSFEFAFKSGVSMTVFRNSNLVMRLQRFVMRIVMVAVCSILFAGAMRCEGQQTINSLFNSATKALDSGDFSGAIGYLEELISALGRSRDSKTIARMQTPYYRVAVCYFFIGEFGTAVEKFDRYLKKYPNGAKRLNAVVYRADAIRFSGKADKAIAAYRDALRRYTFGFDIRTDIYIGISRCYLSQGNWEDAVEPLIMAYKSSPDMLRANWAATMLTTAYLKNVDIEKVYPLVPFLLHRDSLASRSVAFNIAALEAGDQLFGDERYREALWIHRLVYPHDEVLMSAEAYLERLRKRAERLMRRPEDPRKLMRLQESIGELEAELKAMEEVENYDVELYFRIARGYMEMMRYREAREMFLYLHDICDKELSEEALFFAFVCSTYILPWEQAYQIGEQYMDEFPAGEYFDTLTLTMGQMYAKEKNWPKVISHFEESLLIHPEHLSAAQCRFLLGYAAFMEEQFEKAITNFMIIRKEFFESELMPAVTYWTAMAFLFQSNYESAAADFDILLNDFPECMYIEDGAFRRAVCAYGLEEYEEAETRLESFVSNYTESRLAAEATMMRGDVAGVIGAPDEAVSFFKEAMSADAELLNVELYNHCAFKTGEILTDGGDFEEMREHFMQYVDRNREGSNIPQALHYVGKAMWNLGEQSGAMTYLLAKAVEYGRDRNEIGVDLILENWLDCVRKCDPAKAEIAWLQMKAQLRIAESTKLLPLELRLMRASLYEPGLNAAEKAKILTKLLDEDNIEQASPAVLQEMLDTAYQRQKAATERGQDSLAAIQHTLMSRVAAEMIDVFTESDYALDARMVLARDAIDASIVETDREKQKVFSEEAIRHLGVIRTVYAQKPQAAEALLLLGELYMEQRDFKEAEQCYKDVLGYKEWKQHWAQALFGCGQLEETRKQWIKACAYYERIYLMYGYYRSWAAKAYLRRAYCLKRAYMKEKAVETLKAMLDSGEFTGMPELAEARKMYADMGGKETP